MQSKTINPLVSWWMTPKLPYEDIYELPLLKNKTFFAKYLHIFSGWVIHPVKRRLARVYIGLLRRFTDIKIIGVTGSAGKTTTVLMLKNVLSTDGNVVSTPPGIDPVYNIPNTILRCSPGTKYLILEMSVEFPGEMDYYMWLVTPDVGMITNINATHLEFFGNLDGVLKEKSKLIKSLSRDGVAIFNSEDSYLKNFAKKVDMEIRWFKGDESPDVSNWNATETVAKYFDLTEKQIKQGKKSYLPGDHRLQIIKSNGITILDDTYNSNPAAAIAAVKYFSKISKGKKIVVLGDMLQMGSFDEEAHRTLGREVAKHKFDVVVGVGKSSKYLIDEISSKSGNTKTFLAGNCDEAIKTTKRFITPGVYVLVKGSRSIGLDRLVTAIS